MRPSIRTTTAVAVAALALVFFFAPPARAAEDWPKWLGPRGDNTTKETVADAAWPQEGPTRLWSKTVGGGHASPVAAGGKLYLFTLVDRRRETLLALDAETGKELWQQAYERTAVPGGGGLKNPEWDGTRATPTIDGDAIYTFGSAGDLVRRDLVDGKPAWQLNVIADTGAAAAQWGASSSPLVDAERVYVQGGIGEGAPVAVAVDKRTGKFAWRSEAKGSAAADGKDPSGASYAAIVAAEVNGARQLVVFAARDLYGIDPATGRTLWSTPWPTQYDVNGATPVVVDGRVLVTSEYDASKGALFAITPSGPQKVWESKDLKSRFQPVVVEEGYIYANSRGTLTCLAWADGKTVWEAKERDLRLGVGGTILRLADGRMLTMSETGKMSLASVTPKGAKLLAGPVAVFEGKNNWATPLLYDGKIFAKGGEELVAFDVRAK